MNICINLHLQGNTNITHFELSAPNTLKPNLYVPFSV